MRPLLLMALACALCGCGREYWIRGKVVASWPGASASIVEVTGRPTPGQGAPLAGARVRMFYALDGAGRPRPDSLEESTETNGEGFFEIRDYAEPGRQKRIGLEVSRAGYSTQYTTYIDDIAVEPQEFFAVLESR